MATATSTKVLSTTPVGQSVGRRPLRVSCQAVPPMTRVKQAGIAMVGAAILASGVPAMAVDLGLGEEVFGGNCVACHAGGQNSVEVLKTLEKDAIAKYLDGGLDVKAIETQVRNGKGSMPAWTDRLDDDEITSVAAYVFKQASESLW